VVRSRFHAKAARANEGAATIVYLASDVARPTNSQAIKLDPRRDPCLASLAAAGRDHERVQTAVAGLEVELRTGRYRQHVPRVQAPSRSADERRPVTGQGDDQGLGAEGFEQPALARPEPRDVEDEAGRP
jgi:hypothetical protein